MIERRTRSAPDVLAGWPLPHLSIRRLVFVGRITAGQQVSSSVSSLADTSELLLRSVACPSRWLNPTPPDAASVYFPSPLPTTRLSVSTSAIPSAPSPTHRPKLAPGRGSRSKFKDSLGGLQEEEGEEVLSIVRGPEIDDEEGSGGGEAVWAALGREEVSVWSVRVRAV